MQSLHLRNYVFHKKKTIPALFELLPQRRSSIFISNFVGLPLPQALWQEVKTNRKVGNEPNFSYPSTIKSAIPHTSNIFREGIKNLF